MYYLSNFEKGFDLWTTDFKEHKTKILAKLSSWVGGMDFDEKEANIFMAKNGALAKVDVKSGAPKPISFNSEMNLNYSEERAYMFEALKRYEGNVMETARRTGINPRTLWRKIKEYDLRK